MADDSGVHTNRYCHSHWSHGRGGGTSGWHAGDLLQTEKFQCQGECLQLGDIKQSVSLLSWCHDRDVGCCLSAQSRRYCNCEIKSVNERSVVCGLSPSVPIWRSVGAGLERPSASKSSADG